MVSYVEYSFVAVLLLELVLTLSSNTGSHVVLE